MTSRKLLDKAESNDHYIKNILKSKLNILARLNDLYKPSNKRPIKLENDIYIIFMNLSADNGLPHTRGDNLICMPDTNYTEEEFNHILQHELIHIDQKRNPIFWVDLMCEWDMKLYKGSIGSLSSYIRINPDTINTLFIWRNRWVILGIFKSHLNPLLKDINIVWLDIKNNTILNKAPRGWMDFFSDVKGEHPYEMIAYMITEEIFHTTKAFIKIKNTYSLI